MNRNGQQNAAASTPILPPPQQVKRPSPARSAASYASAKYSDGGQTGPEDTEDSGKTRTGAATGNVETRRQSLHPNDEHQHNHGAFLEPPLARRHSQNLIRKASTEKDSSIRDKSPSYMAAQLATSRANPSNNNAGLEPSKQIKLAPATSSAMEDLQRSYATEDETNVADTRSLVQLFESKEVNSLPSRTTSVRYARRPPSADLSKKPLVPKKPIINPKPAHALTVLQKDIPQLPPRQPTASQFGAVAAAANLAGPALAATTGVRRIIPAPPPPRRTGRAARPAAHAESSGIDETAVSSRTDAASGSLAITQTRALPIAQRSLESVRLGRPLERPAIEKVTSQEWQSTSLHTAGGPRRASNGTVSTTDSLGRQMSVSSLANAMVAGSLASSRAPSPSKIPPPLPRRHGKPLLFHRNHSQEQFSRTPSPAKGMRQTMREIPKSDDESEPTKRRGPLVRKHPNKHHEGDRKRYRTQVTERERKRYEGVWAANKGLLMVNPGDPQDCVLNLIVRDIWRRSRLPDDVLEEVWQLVSQQGLHWLTREEYVVGMWLIDQRLKGNKLPIKVSDSVWASVRRLSGIKVPRERR